MSKELLEWMEMIKKFLPKNLGKVLDVGSLDINGSAKEVYTEFESYTGIDMRPGKGVDIVINGHDLVSKFGENSFDTVVCMNTMEHDDKFWLTQGAINKVLKKGGFYVFSAPGFKFPFHPHPRDYWRMSPQAVREFIFQGYEILDLQEYLKHKGMDIALICSIGKKL